MAGKKKAAASGKKGMGFAAAQKQIAKKAGVSPAAAGAILAASTRKAGTAAKTANPNLKNLPKAKGK